MPGPRRGVRRRPWLVAVILAWVTAMLLATALAPGTLDGHPWLDNPTGVSGSGDVLARAGVPLRHHGLLGFGGNSVVGQVVFYAVFLPGIASLPVAAAAFGPLRRRVQSLVDPRFNRRHYDANAVVDRFRHRLQHGVHLDALVAERHHAVGSTVQPRASGLWLATESRR